MTRAFVLALLSAAWAASPAGAELASAPAKDQQPVTVSCSESIGTLRAGDAYAGRVVLGAVSAPGSYLAGVVFDPHFAPPFRYWRKVGLVIRGARAPASVSVPARWRGLVRIGWGNPATPATVVRFAACPQSPTWNAYAGGFWLRTASACAPLTFEVGDKKVTLRFGIGRRCPRPAARAN